MASAHKAYFWNRLWPWRGLQPPFSLGARVESGQEGGKVQETVFPLQELQNHLPD